MKKQAKETKKQEKFIILPWGRKIRIGPDTVPATGPESPLSDEEMRKLFIKAAEEGWFHDPDLP